METVILKNGAKEATGLVTTVMMSIQNLMQEKPIVFYELVMKCRDSNHVIFGNMQKDLEDLALVNSGGGVHDSIRHIVLSAVRGDGLEMKISNPIAKTEQS